MRLNFRQGIVKALVVDGTPSFMVYNTVHNAVTINITSVRLMVTAAYKEQNFLFEHRETSAFAWGPLTWDTNWGISTPTKTFYLYWDWQIGTGQITLNYTGRAPLYGSIAPTSPGLDQHWFDYSDNVMKTWDGTMWNPVIRVFAGSVLVDENFHTGTITHNPIGSQVDLSFDTTHSASITSITRTGNIATVVLATPNNALRTGQQIGISGATQTAYNGTFTITVISSTSFSYVVSGTPVTPATGSITYSYQMLTGYIEAGWVLFGMDQKGILNSDGNLVTSVTNLNTYHGNYTSPVKLELLNSQAVALEPIPAFYAVTNLGDGLIRLATIADFERRPIGIVDRDLMPGESSEIISQGVVYNDQWNWVPSLGKNIYLGADGLLVQGLPSAEPTNIKIGSIIDRRSILVDINNYRGGPTGPGGGATGPTGPMATGPTGPMATGPTGAAGTLLTDIPYDFLYSVYDSVLPLQIIGGSMITKNLILHVGLTGSYAGCEVAPIADCTFNILVNNSVVGSCKILAGSLVGTFTFTGAVTLVPGNIIKVQATDASTFDGSGTINNVYVSINSEYVL